MGDDLLIWAFGKAALEDPSRKKGMSQALYDIASLRNSIALIETASAVMDHEASEDGNGSKF